MIYDKICESRKVNAVNFYAENLWVRLLTKSDDNGNYFRDVRRIHANCMLEKDGSDQAETELAISSLLSVGLLAEYEADGRNYVHLTDFHEYQELRQDRPAQIEHPPHPACMGGAYIGEGMRKDCWVPVNQRPEESVSSESETNQKPIGNRVTELVRTASETKRTPEVEVEVEVKGKEEGKGKEEAPDRTEESFERFFPSFRKRFANITGVAVSNSKPVKKLVQVAFERFGEASIFSAIEYWTKQRGKERIFAKPQYALTNFVEDVEVIIEAMKDSTAPDDDDYHLPRIVNER